MSSKLTPGRIFTSLRHRRGFGVHSPFAFRFITGTLRCPWDYYAYSRLKKRKERTIFRLMAFFDCELKTFGEEAHDFERIHGLAVGPNPRKPGILLAVGHRPTDSEKSEIIRLMPQASGLICFSDTIATALLKDAPCGMSFENLHGLTVYVASSSLPRQHYYISF